MATIIKGDARALKLQAGRSIEEREDGSLCGHCTWIGDAASYPSRCRRGDLHPDDPHLVAFYVKTTRLKLGKIQVDADFIGIAEDPSPYFWEPVGSTGTDPIETHPDFVFEGGVEGTPGFGGSPGAPQNLAVFDPETKEFLGFPANAPDHLGGVRDYLTPSIVLRATYFTFIRPNPSPLGTVVDAGDIDYPVPDGIENFLVTNFGARKTGELYQVTVEVLGSKAGDSYGWNPLIYGAASGLHLG